MTAPERASHNFFQSSDYTGIINMDVWMPLEYSISVILANSEHFSKEEVEDILSRQYDDQPEYDPDEAYERALESPVLYGLMYDDGSEERERECDDYNSPYPEGFWDDYPG